MNLKVGDRVRNDLYQEGTVIEINILSECILVLFDHNTKGTWLYTNQVKIID